MYSIVTAKEHLEGFLDHGKNKFSIAELCLQDMKMFSYMGI